MLLVGDIGGAKTTLAIYAVESAERTARAMATYPSAQYPNLESVVHVFLEQAQLPVDRACFGVAGPVVNRHATITNLPWKMSEEQLQTDLGIPIVHLLNDLEAIAHAVPRLGPDDLRTLNAGVPVKGGAIAVIAPGTGLGEAFLTFGRGGHAIHPSEGGHCDFAPTNKQELGLLAYFLQSNNHVSYEFVCSGQGIYNVYKYLRRSGEADEPAWLTERLAAGDDKTAVIAQAALDASGPDPVCAATMRMFISILGAEAGNLALKVLATGGVYIGGGIPKRNLHWFEEETFLQAFTGKGRFHELLSRVPVHLILNPETALLGAVAYELERLQPVGPVGRRLPRWWGFWERRRAS